MQRASRILGPLQVARGGGAPAQLSLPRNLPLASPQIHSRYLQHSKTDYNMLWLLVILMWMHRCTRLPLSCMLNMADLFTLHGLVLCPQSLIPDIRQCLGQEAVVDLHPEEAVLSGAEDEERERSDQDLQIRRTVTQVGLQLLTVLPE